MPFGPLEYVEETGFPLKVKQLLNDCAGRINRKIYVKFNTESLAPIATVLETEYDITFLFPRGAINSAVSLGPWGLIAGTVGKVKVVKNHPLRLSQNLNDVADIIGIDNSFAPAIGKIFYLQLDYDTDYFITAVTLLMDNPWDEYPVPYTTTGDGTTDSPFLIASAYYMIGYCIDPADDPKNTLDGVLIAINATHTVKVVRAVYGPLMTQWQNMGSGFVIPFPDPPSMPGPS